MATDNIPSFQAVLDELLPSSDRTELRNSLLPALIGAITDIAAALRKAHHVSAVGTANVFGDAQLNVDVESEAIVRDALASCPSVATASSEEDPIERTVHETSAAEGELYTVAFDPLDGSSIIAPNWTVGTIVGIWDGRSALDADPREKQIAAVLGVYGPRTTAIVALRLPGQPGVCFEVGIHEPDQVRLVRPSVRLAEPPFGTRFFAPANLRAAAHEPRYMALVTRYIEENYSLRYAGGLVPDVVHALTKGHGVYVSPVTARSGPKLRRLFELCPVALVLECAGGRAVDPQDGTDVLARKVVDIEEKGGVAFGNVEEVEKVKEVLLG